MLIRFNVRNFLSFSERENGQTQEFSMIAGKMRSKKEHIYDNGKIKLLKFAAVYGANASGKSNLVKAMQFMQKTVETGSLENCTEKYCKTDIENVNKSSYFEMEILLDGKYYAYGFEVILNESRFISEWLVQLHSDNTETVLFQRDIEKGTYELGGELAVKSLNNNLNVYATDIRSDSSVLFLSVMNQNKKNFYEENENAKVLRKIFIWISRRLDISYPNQPISDYSYMSGAENDEKIKEVCKMISAFGTGITNFEVKDIEIDKIISEFSINDRNELIKRIEKEQIRMKQNREIKSFNLIMRSDRDFFIVATDANNIKCKTIKFSHGEKNVLFELAEESDGTIRILDLLEILLAGEGKTYVIDELDRCLHPSLTYKFVETFFELARQKNIQLIATTHESRLMDFDLLRRDEIWFVNKKKSGESDIYSLEEYNARFDQKIDKAYLEGRYGGVPIFSTVFPIKE